MNEFEKRTEETGEGEYAYRAVMNGKAQTRLWSIISLALGALSLILCFTGWVGIVLSIAAVAMAIFSRKNLGYFDKLTLGGIITSIFGFVFSITVMIMNSLSATVL